MKIFIWLMYRSICAYTVPWNSDVPTNFFSDVNIFMTGWNMKYANSVLGIDIVVRILASNPTNYVYYAFFCFVCFRGVLSDVIEETFSSQYIQVERWTLTLPLSFSFWTDKTSRCFLVMLDKRHRLYVTRICTKNLDHHPSLSFCLPRLPIVLVWTRQTELRVAL